MPEHLPAVQWNNIVTARRIRGYQVHVVLDTMSEQKGRGPWSMIIDENPMSGGDGVGPSPVNTAMAALAAWTVVTLEGVARRRNLKLDDIQVVVKMEMPQAGVADKAASVEAAIEGRAIKRRFLKTVTITGDLTERDRIVLQNASKHCPVGQLFDGRSAEFTEDVRIQPRVAP